MRETYLLIISLSTSSPLSPSLASKTLASAPRPPTFPPVLGVLKIGACHRDSAPEGKGLGGRQGHEGVLGHPSEASTFLKKYADFCKLNFSRLLPLTGRADLKAPPLPPALPPTHPPRRGIPKARADFEHPQDGTEHGGSRGAGKGFGGHGGEGYCLDKVSHSLVPPGGDRRILTRTVHITTTLVDCTHTNDHVFSMASRYHPHPHPPFASSLSEARIRVLCRLHPTGIPLHQKKIVTRNVISE